VAETTTISQATVPVPTPQPPQHVRRGDDRPVVTTSASLDYLVSRDAARVGEIGGGVVLEGKTKRGGFGGREGCISSSEEITQALTLS